MKLPGYLAGIQDQQTTMVSRKKKSSIRSAELLEDVQVPKKQRPSALDDPGTSGSSKTKANPLVKREKFIPKHVDEDSDSIDLDIEDIIDGTKKSLKKPTKLLPEVDWSEPDLMELISRMDHAIPPKDNLKLESRVQKLDWDEVCFGDHSAEQCREMWNNIQLRLRRFRLLREVLDDAKEWVTKPWTNFYRSSRGNRHPDLPKRPLSTYMIFYLEKKDKVAKEHPKLEMTGVSKVIAEMYKSLPDKKKQKYTEMAAEQRRLYDSKMEQFYRDHPGQVPKPTSKDSKFSRVVTTGPQKPSTPFKLFCNDKFRKHKDDVNLDKTAFLVKCKDQWRTLSDRKKAEYITRVIDEESKYQEDLKVYKSDNPDFVPPGFKSVLTKDERILIEKVAGKPEKPPNSGYSLFSRLMLVSSEIKQTPAKERMFRISQLWKDMSEDDQNKYKEQVAHLLDQYKLEYATYLESLSEEKKAEELTKNQPKRKLTKHAPKPKPTKKKPEIEVVEEAKQASPRPNTLYKNEPPQPPVNVCILFLEYFMKTATHIPLAQREKKGLQTWPEVPESEKSRLRKDLAERKQQYIKNFEKFLKSLSQEELKEYSRMKASGRIPDELSEDSESDSDTSGSSESGSDSTRSSDSGNEEN